MSFEPLISFSHVSKDLHVDVDRARKRAFSRLLGFKRRNPSAELLNDFSLDLKLGERVLILSHNPRMLFEFKRLVLGIIKPDVGTVVRRGVVAAVDNKTYLRRPLIELKSLVRILHSATPSLLSFTECFELLQKLIPSVNWHGKVRDVGSSNLRDIITQVTYLQKADCLVFFQESPFSVPYFLIKESRSIFHLCRSGKKIEANLYNRCVVIDQAVLFDGEPEAGLKFFQEMVEPFEFEQFVEIDDADGVEDDDDDGGADDSDLAQEMPGQENAATEGLHQEDASSIPPVKEKRQKPPKVSVKAPRKPETKSTLFDPRLEIEGRIKIVAADYDRERKSLSLTIKGNEVKCPEGGEWQIFIAVLAPLNRMRIFGAKYSISNSIGDALNSGLSVVFHDVLLKGGDYSLSFAIVNFGATVYKTSFADCISIPSSQEEPEVFHPDWGPMHARYEWTL